MNEEELHLENDAYVYIKSHERELIEQFCPKEQCHPVAYPVSLFMAGSPGAGKTEISKSLVRHFHDVPIRIDADDIRTFCPAYIGSNAHIFQKAATKGVHILYDYALGHNINCIVDGTFAYKKACENIVRSIKRNRRVEIWFVYQDPVQSWELTKAREMIETRHVSKDVFIGAFFDSRTNVKNAKEEFGADIVVNLLVKNFKTNVQDLHLNISKDDIDRITNNRYSKEDLEQILI
jgi:hypothetical protein